VVVVFTVTSDAPVTLKHLLSEEVAAGTLQVMKVDVAAGTLLLVWERLVARGMLLMREGPVNLSLV